MLFEFEWCLMYKYHNYYRSHDVFRLIEDYINSLSRIHCSEACRNLLHDIGGYVLEKRGCVNLKVSRSILTIFLKVFCIRIHCNISYLVQQVLNFHATGSFVQMRYKLCKPQDVLRVPPPLHTWYGLHKHSCNMGADLPF